MAISMINYVDITSAVSGAAQAPTRNLGGMLITTNILAPTGKIITFKTADDVGLYFGTNSVEYLRAVFYFSYISKVATTPAQLSFWNWNNNAATPSHIFGAPPIDTLSQFNAITTGELTLTLGGFTHTLTAINLSAAGSLAAVATDITTAINAYMAGGAAWTGAVVTYNVGAGAFYLVSGTTGTDVVGVAAAPANDLAGPLGWLNAGTMLSNGTAAQDIPTNLNSLYTVSNNFGSFAYVATLSLANVTLAATWNNSLNPNNQFLYHVPVAVADASTWEAALLSIGGVELTLAPLSNEYPEMCGMMMLAATDYTQRNSVLNYEFNQFNLTPSVTNQADYNTYVNLGINFYGATQTAGQLINFYQQGVMYGLATQPRDQNVYGNEIWFKDAIGAGLMNLLLAVNQIPANKTGIAMVLSTIQPLINQALFNGTISVGATLTPQQIATITQITGSNTAWQQVQNIGYWINATITSTIVNGATQYKILYTLIYKKDDVIRSINGSNILI